MIFDSKNLKVKESRKKETKRNKSNNKSYKENNKIILVAREILKSKNNKD